MMVSKANPICHSFHHVAAGLPVISQLSRNYYFYEATPSVEMRFHTGSELEKTLRSSPATMLVVDPIVERLPETQAWFDAVRSEREPKRLFPIEMYEPVYYQGFDPAIPLDSMPRLIAPFRPGESVIAVYQIP